MEINNPWSRGSYLFSRHIGSQNSVVHKIVSASGGGGGGGGGQSLPDPPPPHTHTHITIRFQFLFFRTYKILSFRFIKHGQEISIFFSGCLNLSAQLFVGNMVLVQNVQ